MHTNLFSHNSYILKDILCHSSCSSLDSMRASAYLASFSAITSRQAASRSPANLDHNRVNIITTCKEDHKLLSLFGDNTHTLHYSRDSCRVVLNPDRSESVSLMIYCSSIQKLILKHQRFFSFLWTPYLSFGIMTMSWKRITQWFVARPAYWSTEFRCEKKLSRNVRPQYHILNSRALHHWSNRSAAWDKLSAMIMHIGLPFHQASSR